MSRYFNYTEDDYVAHFGIKGMKWGVRRYRKSNGSLTPAGKSRYKSTGSSSKKNKSTSFNKKKYYRKSALKIYAGLTVGAGVVFYAKHKHQIDSLIARALARSFVRSKMNNGSKFNTFKPEGSVIDVPFREINS